MKLRQIAAIGFVLTGTLAAQQPNPSSSGTTPQRPAGTQNSGPQTAKPREMKPLGPQKSDLNRDAESSVVSSLPANAERVDDLHYRAKDDKGVVWTYTKTPFGLMKAKADEGTKALTNDPDSGRVTGPNERACVAGDNTPDGAVSKDGYTKTITKSPFGTICRWTK